MSSAPLVVPRSLAALHLIAGAAILSLAALFYGQVFIFHDSGSYYQYGQHIASEARAILRWTRAAIFPLGAEAQDYLGARSPAYSVIFYVATRWTTLWGVVALQALACAAVLRLAASQLAPERPLPAYWAAIGVLTLGTPLSYFVSYAMPDVFAGIGAIALALLLTWEDGGAGQRAATWALLALSAAFHPSLPPVFLAAGAGIVIFRLMTRDGGRGAIARDAGIALAAVLIGWASGPAYRAAEHVLARHPIAAPPFLTARLIEDGTGLDMLDRRCGRDRDYALCHVPMPRPMDANAFLWNRRGEGGAYLAVDPATRARIRAEEPAFALDAMREDPARQLRSAAANMAEQARMVEAGELLADPRTQESYRLFQPMAGAPQGPVDPWIEPALSVVRAIVLPGAIAACAILLIVSRRSRPFIVGAVGALLANAAICGMMSKPWPRYQARIVWIIPAAAVLLAMGGRRRSLTLRARRAAAIPAP